MTAPRRLTLFHNPRRSKSRRALQRPIAATAGRAVIGRPPVRVPEPV